MITKWINTILNKFGYYKFEMPKGTSLSESEILGLMATYGENKEFKILLRDLASRDMELYYAATSDRDRWVVRGARDRSLYFLSLIQKAHAKQQRNK